MTIAAPMPKSNVEAATAPARTMVTTHRLTKRYGDVLALDHVSLSIERGEVFGLLGPNGAGKTTLLRTLLGYLTPSEGSATIDGLDCQRQRLEVHERVAYLPGDARLFPWMRADDTLRFFADVRGARGPKSSDDLLVNFRRFAGRLELDLKRRVGFMSTGMRQKLALSITLGATAPLIILDEPTANLDPTVRGEIETMVREAQNDGTTICFSSHVLSEVEAVCDRVAIMRAGKLVHEQRVSELKRHHRITAQLSQALAEPPVEFKNQIQIERIGENVVIETAMELAPLLGWLSRQPLSEISIEPFGLREVYRRYHPGRAE
jgi:ABC-2 type transport system ATP-binding protein